MPGNTPLDEWKNTDQNKIWTEKNIPQIEADWAKKPKQPLKHKTVSALILGSVLDVGCGTGDLVTALKENHYPGAYLGVDPSEAMLERARTNHPRHHFIQGNLYDLDHIAPADTVVCLDVLHHQKDLEPGFTNLLNKARKRLIVTLWINDRDKHHPKQTKGQYGEWITYYTEKELENWFSEEKYAIHPRLGCAWKDMYIFEVK